MTQSRSLWEITASRSFRSAGTATPPVVSTRDLRGARKAKTATISSRPVVLKMFADRAQRQPADDPDSKRDQRHAGKRAPAARIERFLGQARRHKTRDIELLAVGGSTGPIECIERMLIG